MKKIFQVFIIGCLFVVIPILVAVLLVGKAIQLLRPIAHIVTEFFNLQSFFGTAAVTIVCLIMIVLLCSFFGLLLQRGFIKVWSSAFEERLFYFLPTFQMLKYRVVKAEKYEEQHFWKPILLKDGDFYNIALITDESSEGFLTVYIPDAPKMDAGEIRYILKDHADYHEITMKEAMNSIHSFGKGMPLDHILKRNTIEDTKK